MTKPTKWPVRPAKTQISLCICPVWSESSLKKAWILSYPLSAQRRLWSDWVDAQADLILRWAHMPFYFVGFVMRWLMLWFVSVTEHVTSLLMNRLIKTESAIFVYLFSFCCFVLLCLLFIFSKDPSSQNEFTYLFYLAICTNMLRHGPRQAKKYFQACAKCADSDHPAHAQSISRAFALQSHILKYPVILLADSEGLDQTARMRRLICAFAVRIRSKTRFRMVRFFFFFFFSVMSNNTCVYRYSLK